MMAGGGPRGSRGDGAGDCPSAGAGGGQLPAAALARRHAKDDIALTLMRLDVLGQLAMHGSRHTLPAAEAGHAGRQETAQARFAPGR
jgi:hypothetical protein